MVAVIAGSILTVAVVTGLSIIEEAYAIKQENVGSGESTNLNSGSNCIGSSCSAGSGGNSHRR